MVLFEKAITPLSSIKEKTLDFMVMILITETLEVMFFMLLEPI